ncbi:MAG TPA: ankyrin repeat domain-containing protein [Pyrinomonadaceae bacterium]|nr:ankyrin repeat domain-containing protein [Pyrinomonadaceae bacterium]
MNRELLDAVVVRDARRVGELLKRGADANARDAEHDETPLMLAARFADAGLVRLLLDAGAEVDARDDKARTALFYAPVPSDVFEALRIAGADVDARDGEGNTVLMRKVYESASLVCVDELLRLGVDPSAENEDGETAFEIAERLGLVKLTERLARR